MHLSTHACFTICSTPYPTNLGTLMVMTIPIDFCGQGGIEWGHRNFGILLCCIIRNFVHFGTTSIYCSLTSTIFKLENDLKEIARPAGWCLYIHRFPIIYHGGKLVG